MSYDERWRDSYDAWKTREPDHYRVDPEIDERDPCREGECPYWPGCGCEWDLPEIRDGEPEPEERPMCDQEQEHCERCDDTGWIAVRTRFPMSYVGPGPCPEYASGVCDAPCDRCDRGYEHRRRRLGQ